MKHIRLIIAIAVIGIIIGIISAYIYGKKVKAEPPLTVNYNPYENGIYATGIIESYQENGVNINVYPEVSGRVTKIFATDGTKLKQDDPILTIDDSTQKNIVDKDKADMEAALALLEKLRAAPRKEDLDVALAQLNYATDNLKNFEDQLVKISESYKLNPKSVSKNSLDNAINAKKVALGNFTVAKSQYDLVKSGTWSYDIENQEKQYLALKANYQANKELLNKYTIKASINGEILSLSAAIGSYISPQGIYDSYTQTMQPVVVMGVQQPYMQVRCYVDELLIPRLPKPSELEAKLLVRGENNYTIALEFLRVQPYTIPNINLSYEKAVRVDVRVLPIVFRFAKPSDINLYSGQLVDIYIKGKDTKKKDLAQSPNTDDKNKKSGNSNG